MDLFFWELARASGLAAYAALCIAVLTGIAPRRTALLEAVAAVDRLVATGLERHARFAAAVAACGGEHLALAAVSAATAAAATVTAARVSAATATTAASATLGATRSAVGRATGRGVLETAAGVKLLLAGRPDEFLPAVLAGQGLVLKAHVGILHSSRPTSRFVRAREPPKCRA